MQASHSPVMFLLGPPHLSCKCNLALRPLCLEWRDPRRRARGQGGKWVPPWDHGSGIWPPSSAIVTINKASGRISSTLTGLTSSNV